MVVLVHCSNYALALWVEGGDDDDEADGDDSDYGYDDWWCKMMVVLVHCSGYAVALWRVVMMVLMIFGAR